MAAEDDLAAAMAMSLEADDGLQAAVGSLEACLEQAVRCIDAAAPDAAAKCKDVLSKLLANLASNPGNDKFRRVRKVTPSARFAMRFHTLSSVWL